MKIHTSETKFCETKLYPIVNMQNRFALLQTVCVCVCVYVCMFMCMYASMQNCVALCISSLCACMHILRNECVHVWNTEWHCSPWACVHVHVCICTCIQVYMHEYMQQQERHRGIAPCEYAFEYMYHMYVCRLDTVSKCTLTPMGIIYVHMPMRMHSSICTKTHYTNAQHKSPHAHTCMHTYMQT